VRDAGPGQPAQPGQQANQELVECVVEQVLADFAQRIAMIELEERERVGRGGLVAVEAYYLSRVAAPACRLVESASSEDFVIEPEVPLLPPVSMYRPVLDQFEAARSPVLQPDRPGRQEFPAGNSASSTRAGISSYSPP